MMRAQNFAQRFKGKTSVINKDGHLGVVSKPGKPVQKDKGGSLRAGGLSISNADKTPGGSVRSSSDLLQHPRNNNYQYPINSMDGVPTLSKAQSNISPIQPYFHINNQNHNNNNNGMIMNYADQTPSKRHQSYYTNQPSGLYSQNFNTHSPQRNYHYNSPQQMTPVAGYPKSVPYIPSNNYYHPSTAQNFTGDSQNLFIANPMPNLSSTLDPQLFQSVLPVHNNNQPSNSVRASLDGNLSYLNARGNMPPMNSNNNFNKGKLQKSRFSNKKTSHPNNSNMNKVRTERANYNSNQNQNNNNDILQSYYHYQNASYDASPPQNTMMQHGDSFSSYVNKSTHSQQPPYPVNNMYPVAAQQFIQPPPNFEESPTRRSGASQIHVLGVKQGALSYNINNNNNNNNNNRSTSVSPNINNNYDYQNHFQNVSKYDGSGPLTSFRQPGQSSYHIVNPDNNESNLNNININANNNNNYKFGGLGPNLGTQDWMKRKQKAQAAAQYSRNIQAFNKSNIVANPIKLNSRGGVNIRKAPTPQITADHLRSEKQKAFISRQRALEFAKNIPKPKQSNIATEPVSRGVMNQSGMSFNSSSVTAGSEVLMEKMEELEARHSELQSQVARIRAQMGQ